MSINNRKHLSIGENGRRLGAGLVATTLAAVGLPLVATSAWAVAGINNPPVLPHAIIAFPSREFVSASGYAAGDRPIVQVVRSGFVVGRTLPIVPQDDPGTPEFDGLVDINHGTPEPCWEGVTPDMRPGDVIRVLTAPGVGDETRIAGVTVTQPATLVTATTVTIKGNAVSATGVQIPLAQLEARVVANKQAFFNGKRTLRADATGTADGTLSYDGAGTTWTATFTKMDRLGALGVSDGARAVANESRGMWNGANPLVLSEQTIFEFGQAAGPGVGCLAPFAKGPTVRVAAASDTGVSNSDGITSKLSPTFTGLPGLPTTTRVNLYVDGVLRGTQRVAPGNAYSITPTTALTAGRHTVTAGEIDPTTPAQTMGNAPASVTIDTTRPTVLRKAPAAGALGVSRVNNLTATLSENVSGASRGTFMLRKGGATGVGQVVAVTYYPRLRVALMNPAARLAANSRYTAILSTGIKDLAGNPIPSTVWTFTTGAS